MDEAWKSRMNWAAVLAKYSKGRLSSAQLDQIMLHDKFLSPAEAIEYGIIDGVVGKLEGGAVTAAVSAASPIDR